MPDTRCREAITFTLYDAMLFVAKCYTGANVDVVDAEAALMITPCTTLRCFVAGFEPYSCALFERRAMPRHTASRHA